MCLDLLLKSLLSPLSEYVCILLYITLYFPCLCMLSKIPLSRNLCIYKCSRFHHLALFANDWPFLPKLSGNAGTTLRPRYIAINWCAAVCEGSAECKKSIFSTQPARFPTLPPLVPPFPFFLRSTVQNHKNIRKYESWKCFERIIHLHICN